MKITFIVLIDYKGKYIEQCLNSFCNEFFNCSEVIIINSNCTNDNMEKIIKYRDKYKNINIIDVTDEKKKYEIINTSITNANGNFLYFLQDTDEIDISGFMLLANEAMSKKLEIIEGKAIGIEVINQKYATINTKNNILNKNNFIQNKIYDRKFFIENKIFLNRDDTNFLKTLILKAEILKNSYKILDIPCCYTRRITEKYKYYNIIKDNNSGIYEIEKNRNTYLELINLVKELDDNKKKFGLKIIYKSCIKYVVNEGINYVNIDDNKQRILNHLNEIVELVDFDYYKPNKKELKIIEYIKTNNINKYRKFQEKIKNKNKFKKSPKRTIRQYIYGKIYRIISLIPNYRKQVLFLENMTQMSGNFKYIRKEIDKYNEDKKGIGKIKYRTISLNATLKEKLLFPYYIGRANYIVLAEHIPYISYLKKRNKTKVIQTWHAAGAFKKFGHSTSYMPGGPNPFKNIKMELHSNYDIATVSSPEIVKYYSEAFRLNEYNIKPIGLPRADFFFDEEEKKLVKEQLYNMYPLLKDKKIIVYAPTFRGSGSNRKQFDMEFDYNKLAENISDDYVIVLKLHPSVNSCDIVIDEKFKNKVFNLSDYGNINDLLIITDILIADYSSVVFEYSLLERPIIFYAYDLEEYAMDRDLYYRYEEFIPGPLAVNMEELIKIINNNCYDLKKVKEFGDKFFYKKDGNTSKRFLEEILLK